MKRISNKPTGIEGFVDKLKQLVESSKVVIKKSVGSILGEPSKHEFDPKRRKLLKKVAIGTAGVATGVIAYNIFSGDEKSESNSDGSGEISEKVEKELREFCKLKNLKKAGGKKQDDYELKYYDPNKVDNSGPMDRRVEQKKVLKGFRAMLTETCTHDGVEKTHLQMILDLADEYNVPAEILFLALNESGWQKGANSSAKAVGYRQFVKKTLVALGGNRKKDAQDPVKSTELTMILYKQNLKRVKLYLRKIGIDDTDKNKKNLDTAYKYGLAHHNCSPKMIKFGILNGGGDFDNHYDAIKKYSKSGGLENARYVPRLLAIRNSLKRLNEEGKLNVDATVKKIDKIIEEDDKNTTNADKMYEKFLDNAGNKNENQLIAELNKILEEYQKEKDEGKITEKYFEGAKSVIQEKIDTIKASSNKQEEDEEEDEDIGIVELNKSKDGRFQIYSYQIKDHANRNILLKKFRQEVDRGAQDGKFFLTNMSGEPYPTNKEFKKGENIFIRYRLEDSFKKVNNGVYKIEIKKHATSKLIKKKFLQEFSAKKLTEKDIKVCNETGEQYPSNKEFKKGDKVYVKIIKK